jgi:hypothetical protein
MAGSFVLKGRELAQHVHCIGTTGQGKSKLLASIFVQLLNQGIAVALIDPHSDLALDILGLLLDSGYFKERGAFDKLWYVDFSNQTAFLPFNVLRSSAPAHIVARNVVEAFKRAWPALGEGAAPQFENIMLNGVFVLIENGLPLTAMPQLLTDKPYRDGLLQKVSDPHVVHFFQQRFDRWGKEAPLMIESTLRRITLLTFTPTLRYSLGQNDNRLDFRRLMDEGVSVIYNLGALDEDTQRFLGGLLTIGYEVAALSRADVPESRRTQYHLILDEFSMYSAQSEEALSRVLSLARKYGLFLTMAHQTFSQVSERLRGALQNCVEITFRVGQYDSRLAADIYTQFDPQVVKYEASDPNRAPVFLQASEQSILFAQELQELQPQQAYVKFGSQKAKSRR